MFLKTDGAGNLSFDSLSFSTPLAVIGNATSGSEIRLPEDTDNGSNYVALKAPDTIASNLTLTLPSADGSSGQVLQTNGSGVLSFAGVSASAGQVIQVVQATDTTQRTTTSSSYVTASNTLSVSITPSSASNKIFILVTGSLYVQAGGVFGTATIFKDGTNLHATGFAKIYDSSDDNASPFAMSYYDAGGDTSSHTYDVRLKTTGSTLYLQADSGSFGQIVAMEIKG